MNNPKPCGCGCTPIAPEMCYNNVVKKCFVEEVPHVVNYNTHVVNECVKKHITVPKYTTTEETVYIDEYETLPYQMQYPMQPIQQPQNQIPQGMQMPNMFNPFQF